MYTLKSLARATITPGLSPSLTSLGCATILQIHASGPKSGLLLIYRYVDTAEAVVRLMKFNEDDTDKGHIDAKVNAKPADDDVLLHWNSRG